MSTTYAIKIMDMYSGAETEIEVAHTALQGQGKPRKIKWLNSVASLLKKKVKVYPTDNGCCGGVNDIGDLRKLYRNYMEDQKVEFLKKVDTLTQLRNGEPGATGSTKTELTETYWGGFMPKITLSDEAISDADKGIPVRVAPLKTDVFKDAS